MLYAEVPEVAVSSVVDDIPHGSICPCPDRDKRRDRARARPESEPRDDVGLPLSRLRSGSDTAGRTVKHRYNGNNCVTTDFADNRYCGQLPKPLRRHVFGASRGGGTPPVSHDIARPSSRSSGFWRDIRMAGNHYAQRVARSSRPNVFRPTVRPRHPEPQICFDG
jgi:hypothetical protein